MSLKSDRQSWTLLTPSSAHQTDDRKCESNRRSVSTLNGSVSRRLQLGSQPILDLNQLTDYERAADEDDFFDLYFTDDLDSDIDSSSVRSYLFEDLSKYYDDFSQSSEEFPSSPETAEDDEDNDEFLFLPPKASSSHCAPASSSNTHFRNIVENFRRSVFSKQHSNTKNVNDTKPDTKECNLYTILPTYEISYSMEEKCPRKEANLEAQLIAQSIGHAFQLAYLEFLKANGIEDPQVFKDMDYQEVLNQQEIFAEELHLFADKDTQKEVIVPKQRNEPLGIVIVESGWGSMLPTVVLANMNPTGPAARCGQLNIGNQIMAINGQSLVGLPLSTCQQYIKNCRNQTSVKLTIVSCPPVVEVLIKRPDVKYQLGFSVQNGVICSLLRGGIAERGGIRVGHRIIEINGQSVVAVPHEKIVNMLATGVGEIHLRTMPTSIFRLLTGQETPHYI